MIHRPLLPLAPTLMAAAVGWFGCATDVPPADPPGARYLSLVDLPLEPDADGDGLVDRVETGTNVFVGPDDTGTNPNDDDTDRDGLSDGDEVLGTTLGLDLPGLGCNPLRKNILIEYDWFDDATGCEAHTHRPTAGSFALLEAAFRNAPVTNPDGSTGIDVINDYGQGGLFTGGNFIDDPDGNLVGDVSSADFQTYKTTHFDPARQFYFHYAIMAHEYSVRPGSSGVADRFGDDLIVSLGCYGHGDDWKIATTTMHELGHNLGLHHGGVEAANYKPNYNSVMNYAYQWPGVDTTCDPIGDLALDYSRNQRIALDENRLRESAGVCGRPGWDWNGDGRVNRAGIFEPIVRRDINQDLRRSVLRDHDDWAFLVYDIPEVEAQEAEVIVCDNPVPMN